MSITSLYSRLKALASRIPTVLITVIVLALMLILVLNIYRYRQNQAQIKIDLAAYTTPRGVIYDSNDIVLAENTVAYEIWAEVHRIKEIPFELLYEMRTSLGLKLANAESRIKRAQFDRHPYRTIILERNIPAKQVELISQTLAGSTHDGIFLHEVPARDYPKPYLAPEVIGIAGDQQHGLSGIEYALDSHLSEGNYLQLTLDSAIQQNLKIAINKLIAATQATSARAMIVRRDGAIVAMAQYPTFNPKDKSTIDARSINSSITRDVYEPGRVITPLIWAAAIDQQLIAKDDYYDTNNGVWRYKNKIYRDAAPCSHALSSTEAIRTHSNIAAAKVALKVGADNLYRILRSWGIGYKTGIELQGESAGLLSCARSWSEITLTQLAIGYESAWTVAQIARAYTGVVNDGLMPPLRLLKQQTDKKSTRVLKPATASWLISVLDEGQLGYNAIRQINSSAMMAREGHYRDNEITQTHIGFFPANVPQFTVVIQLERPTRLRPHFGNSQRIIAPVYDVLVNKIKLRKS